MRMRQQHLWRAAVLFAAGLTLTPTGAAAHVKWFVESADPTRPRVDWSLVFSQRTGIMLAVAAVALGLMYLLQRLLGDAHWPDLPLFRKMAIGAPTLLAVQAAVTLVYAAVQPALFVPNIPLPRDAFGFTLAAVEILVAFSFITGIADWVAAIALMLLVPLSVYRMRWFDTLDMLFWIGIGVVILVIGRYATDVTQVRPWFRNRDPAWSVRTVAVLRIITGLAIVAPALSEKLWNPALAAAFLAEYPDDNFMRSVFHLSWFTDDRFMLAVGVVEATIGIVLVSGFLTRVVILAMWLPFNIGIPFLPPQELLGHLPIFGIMYFLLVHSSGVAPLPQHPRLLPSRDNETAGRARGPNRPAPAVSRPAGRH